MKQNKSDNKQEDKPEKEIADITDNMSEEMKKKHEESKLQYPEWKPKTEGQNLDIYIEKITAMKDFNGIGKHAILMICRTKNEKFPMISFFPNSVCVNQFEKFTTAKAYGNGFESMKEQLQTLTGRTFNVLYKGEKPASQRGFQPYKDYSVVEI